MMEASRFLLNPDFPYCKGCGHHLLARNTVRALEAAGFDPLDVVLVTDIGCHGIVDRNFATHTAHGLHGRSVALGAGMAMALPPGKKVVIFIGDGGATIGLQHILEAARLNLDMAVVVHNNFVYGMTGGQPSGLTPRGFRTAITPQGSPLPHHDLCRLVHDAGAPYAARLVGQGDFSAQIRAALEVEGFALVEVLELCVSYGVKMNPELRLRELARQAGYEPGVWEAAARPPFRLGRGEGAASLLEMRRVRTDFRSPLEGRLGVILGGSAGEGVQKAAEIFAQATMASGLQVTKKGGYPVTVGIGFSNAELILAREPIAYHGISQPEAVIVTSAEGLRYNLERIREMDRGILWLDAGLTPPETGAEMRVRDFRGRAGPRNAALYGLVTFARETGVIPLPALVQAVRASSIGDRVPPEVLEV